VISPRWVTLDSRVHVRRGHPTPLGSWRASPSQSAGRAPLHLSWFGHSTWRRARRNICQCWQRARSTTPASLRQVR